MNQNYYMFKNWDDGDYLITNELGYYGFLPKDFFQALVREDYASVPEDVIAILKEKKFLYDVNRELFLKDACEDYRLGKQYLFYGTCLHIFVVTNACNMSCVYCQAQDTSNRKKGFMDMETAEKAVEIAMQSPSRSVTFEFQGGEPLLNFSVIRHIIEYAEAIRNDKAISYSLVTNTLLLSEDMIAFFKDHQVSISTSLDGGRDVHDANRPDMFGGGTQAHVLENIRRMQKMGLKPGAIQTTTRKSLAAAEAIVEAYLSAGLDSIFLRPLTPLGYAREHWDTIGYRAEEFLAFYKEALECLLKQNAAGHFIREGHATIFLNKILNRDAGNYMELRSPCGAGIGQMAYYYDGNVYTCDEGRMVGEMGLNSFKMGTVSDSYDILMGSRACKVTCQASLLEAQPACCDCVYHPYCGVCPVINMAMDNNIYAREANSYRCQVYKGILDILFNYIKKDGVEKKILESWLC